MSSYSFKVFFFIRYSRICASSPNMCQWIRKTRKCFERFSDFWSNLCPCSKFIRWRKSVWCCCLWLFTNIYGWIDTSACWCYWCQVNWKQAVVAVINVTVVVTDTIYCLPNIKVGGAELLQLPMHTQFCQFTSLCASGSHKYIFTPSKLLVGFM